MNYYIVYRHPLKQHISYFDICDLLSNIKTARIDEANKTIVITNKFAKTLVLWVLDKYGVEWF